MVAEIGEKIALITYPGEEQAAALRLPRIGSDNVIGYLNVDHDGVFPAELADLVQTAPRVTVAELDRLLAQDAVILDRHPQSRRGGQRHHPRRDPHPAGAVAGPHNLVPTDKPIVVHCAGGWRSSVAASLMRANGFRASLGSGRRLQRVGPRPMPQSNHCP